MIVDAVFRSSSTCHLSPMMIIRVPASIIFAINIWYGESIRWMRAFVGIFIPTREKMKKVIMEKPERVSKIIKLQGSIYRLKLESNSKVNSFNYS